MGFSEAVRRWEEWQLPILVLTSLFLQWFLFFAGTLRKRSIPSWLRFLIWLTYVSSDAVAIYALAALFSWQRTQEEVSTQQFSSRLQVLWAAILLIHLGGQDEITAYNIEDNELWRRHVITAVYQVAVAVYVFVKWWPQDKIVLAIGVLIFAVGILKCILKPVYLKRASINSLVDSSRSEQVRSLSSIEEQYVQDATRYFQEGHGYPLPSPEDDEVWKPYDLFVDLTPHHLIRLSCLKALVHDDALKAHRLVRYGLSVMFDRLYTKVLWHTNAIQLDFDFRQQLPVPGYHKLFFWISLLVFLITVFASLLGLQIVTLTFTVTEVNLYGLLIRAICICFFCIFFFFILRMPTTNNGRINKGKSRWPDEVAQYNLIWYLARNRKHRFLRRLATVLVCKDYIDQLWCMKPSKSSLDITRLVHGYIAKGWEEHHMRDMATYRAFNDNRGQWTLKKEGCGSSLDWSLRRPFDESVLLWHLATDFCFHLTAVKLPSDFDEAAHRCRLMSNYMVYLLFVNPEMLMTGARRFLFREAYRQLKEILKLTPPQPDAAAGPSRQRQGEFARKIAQNVQLQHDSGRVDYMGHHFRYVYDAWRLAQHLKNLGVEQGDAKMWRVVQGVWVEMLCFSAGRCSGYLHAKSLGKGGEYLSYVWLLMNYMGMETLAEKMQRSDNGTTTASSSDIATGASANGTTVAIPVPDPGRGHGDHTTEASVPVTEGGDAGGMIPASPVQTTDGGGHGRTATSPVTLTPSGGDEIV